MPEKLTGTMFDNTDEQIDMRGLVRLGLWGSAAIGALLLAVMAVQSDTGARRVASGLNADTTGQLAAPQAGNRNRDQTAGRVRFARCRRIAIACSPA